MEYLLSLFASFQSFAQAVRRVLCVISDNDPAGFHCMDKSYLDKKGWVFEFSRVTMFVTTFAPFYAENHSRYNFGAQNAYILFQPEISFAQHDLPPDTHITNWDNPKTVRDHIRVAFKNAGRPYKIRDTIYFPMVLDIVKPLNEMEDEACEWWKRENDFICDNSETGACYTVEEESHTESEEE